MSDLTKLEQYRDELMAEITDRNLLDGDYCILVCVGKVPKFGYKNISHFMTRVLDDIKNVDPMFSIEFTMMVFES